MKQDREEEESSCKTRQGGDGIECVKQDREEKELSV